MSIEWSGETIAQLRALWDEGLSTAEIGRRMGVSKNTIVGKAHRLNLPPRPSPIIRDGSKPQAAVPRVVRVTTPHPVKPVARGPYGGAARLAAAQAASAAPVVAAPVPAPKPAPAPALAVALDRSASPCCWPIGTPRTAGFRYCDAPSLAGKPYCPEHAARAYQQKDRAA